jgi:hypothetical protein
MTVASAPAANDSLWRKALHVAWLSILLGLTLEILILVLHAYTNTAGHSPRPFVADLAQKVSWSLFVCIGLALGTTVSKARARVMGLLGLISAPLGFSVARSVHKGVNQALGLGAAAGGASLLVVGGLKALEYGVLGAVLGALTRPGQPAGLGRHLGTGAAVGLTFGSAIVAVLASTAAHSLTLVELAARGIGEVLFPVGCSLVLYAADVIGKRSG